MDGILTAAAYPEGREDGITGIMPQEDRGRTCGFKNGGHLRLAVVVSGCR